jgi:hypothetical protein
MVFGNRVKTCIFCLALSTRLSNVLTFAQAAIAAVAVLVIERVKTRFWKTPLRWSVVTFLEPVDCVLASGA